METLEEIGLVFETQVDNCLCLKCIPDRHQYLAGSGWNYLGKGQD